MSRSAKFYDFIFISLIIYAIFDMQTSQVTGNAGVSRTNTHLALILLIGLHGVFLFLSIAKRRHFYVTATAGITILITLWILILDVFCEIDLWTMLTHCGLSALWMFAQYFYSVYPDNHACVIERIQKRFFLLLLVYAVGIVYYMIQMWVTKGRLLVSNLAYNMLVLLPWFYVPSAKDRDKVATIIVAIFTLITLKRGAIIAFVLMFLFAMSALGKIKNQQNKYIGRLILLSSVFIIVACIVDSYLGGALFSRFTVSQMQGGSGRTDMYKLILEALSERNITTLFFGTGSGSSSLLLGTGAHNEWLEFLYSFGIVGVGLYFCLLISMIKQTLKLKRYSSEMYISIAMSTIYFTCVGLYGGMYFVQSSYFLFALIGYSNYRLNEELMEYEK